MRTYSLTEFQECLPAVLDQVERELVIIQRNGREYEIRLRRPARRSGLEAPGIDINPPATLDSILEDIQAGHERRE